MEGDLLTFYPPNSVPHFLKPAIRSPKVTATFNNQHLEYLS